MAAYETSRSGIRGTVVGHGWAREIIALGSVSVAMTTAMLDNANDDVGLFSVSAGAVVTGILVSATDMDSATGLVFDIGDSADEDRLFAASTLGQAGGASTALAVTGVLHKYTAQTQIRAYIATAATTPVAGTLKVVLFGFIDPGYDTTALVAAIPA